MERNKLEERQERIKRAEIQKQKYMEKERKNNIQMRITQSLGELPENKRILLDREMEKERRLLMKEAKEEIWKKWRQKKGRKSTNPKIKTREDKDPLEEKLMKVELEVAKYKEIREKMRYDEMKGREKNEEDEETRKTRRLATKKRLEGYWEKLRWVTKILEETSDLQSQIKKMRSKDAGVEERKRNWNMLSEEKKKETLKREVMEERNKQNPEEGWEEKEERLQEALRMKRIWKEEDQREVGEEDEEEDPGEEDFLGPETFCLTCCMTPCTCMLREVERRLEMVRTQQKIEELEGQIKARRREESKKKRKIELEEDLLDTPSKKTKPDKDIARVPPKETQQNCPQQREGSSPAV